jgi:hypothetical protein
LDFARLSPLRVPKPQPQTFEKKIPEVARESRESIRIDSELFAPIRVIRGQPFVPFGCFVVAPSGYFPHSVTSLPSGS